MPQRKVIIPQRWTTELSSVFKTQRMIYIWAFTGWGKTSVICAALDSAQTKYDYICAGQADAAERIHGLSRCVAVIDDAHLLNDRARMALLAQLDDESLGRRYVVLSRIQMPSWLKPYFATGQIKEYDCEALRWDTQEVMTLFRGLGSSELAQHIPGVLKESQGYPLAIYFYALRLAQSCSEIQALRQTVQEDLFGYLDVKLRAEWDRPLWELMMSIAGFPVFEAELARMLTGRNDIRLLLERACCYGLCFEPPDHYTVSPILMRYLQARQKREWSQDRLQRNRCTAGLYYELQDDIRSAMRCYVQADDREKISDLLILDARRNPGEGNFYELEPYYDLLEEQQILASPELMSGMAMLRAMCFRPEESNRWYDALKAYHQDPARTASQRANAAANLRYLDIALPQFASRHTAKQLMAFARSIISGKEKPRTVTMTSSLPSLLNGSKDFCHWTPRDRTLGRVWKHPIELVAGINGAGLADTAVGESLLEKSWEKNDTEPLMLLNAGMSAARSGKAMEISFVAAAQTSRFMMAQGKPDMALEHLNRFEEMFVEQMTPRMRANLHAAQVRIALQQGETLHIREWLRTEAPDERFVLRTMDRFCLLTKVRCYLLAGENLNALTLLDTLLRYAEQYGRTYIEIEVQMLTAIALYRDHREGWRTAMEAALEKARKYQFIRLISDEGVAVRPLLEELNLDMSIPYDRHLMMAVKRHSIYYTRYLLRMPSLLEALSESECLALRLIAQGCNNKEMAALIGVSPNTIKYYIKNIYEKLGVSTRAEATRRAGELFRFSPEKLGLEEAT